MPATIKPTATNGNQREDVQMKGPTNVGHERHRVGVERGANIGNLLDVFGNGGSPLPADTLPNATGLRRRRVAI